MVNGIRTGDPRGFNKGHSLKFRVDSQVQQTPEEGQRTYWLKHCGNNNKDEDNSPKTLMLSATTNYAKFLILQFFRCLSLIYPLSFIPYQGTLRSSIGYHTAQLSIHSDLTHLSSVT